MQYQQILGRDEKVPYERLEWPRTILVLVTLFMTADYMIWRYSTLNPSAPIFSWLLYIAESVGVLTLLMHYFMVRRLTVREAPLPKAGHTVDVFIPTINESVDVVRRTLIKASTMDYPHKTYVLDDGNRPEMRALAVEMGCEYLARGNNEDSKAGNLNYGFQNSSGEFIAIFDADHAPKRSFLLRTLGYFEDPKVAFVQTPQDFYNLDSFQHRVERSKGRMWTEQSLFFRIIQRGKDYWNAAFFCGSCAVLRRSALQSIGGFATGTITEDIHTSIRLHKKGYRSVYHCEPLAFGIAASQLEPFLRQRIRWGQGAMQVWRKEGVIFTFKLTFAQKICYVASMFTYFDGWQKFIYYVTPAIVLTTGWLPILTNTHDFLLHFVPYFFLMLWTFEELGRGYGRTIVIEQYNMARFAAFCYATVGLVRGKLKFRVTNKKLTAGRANFWFLMPQYLVLFFNIAAIPVGIILYLHYGFIPEFALVANVLWSAVNLMLSGVVLGFSLKRADFRRNTYRFNIPLVARLRTGRGAESFVAIDDLSCVGALILASRELGLAPGDTVQGDLYLPDGTLPFTASIRAIHSKRESSHMSALGCEFVWIDQVARGRLEQFLYGSDFEWQIHSLSERNGTMLQWIMGKHKQDEEHMLPAWHKSQNQVIFPMLMRSPDTAETQVNTGIISVDTHDYTGSLMVFNALPENKIYDTILFTQEGWKTMRAKVANQNKSDQLMSNVYLYELEGVPA